MELDGRQPIGESPTERGSLVGHLERWRRLTTGAFLLILAGLVVLLATNRLYLEPRVRDAVESARLVRLTNEAMLDQETGLRGFLATGDASFLRSYSEGRRALADLLPDVERHLSEDGTTGRLLVEMRLAQQGWLDGWVPDALAAGDAGLAGDDLTDLLRDGRQLFDRYRTTYDAISTELVNDREEALDLQSTALLVTILGALAITATSGILAWRSAHRLRRSSEGPLREVLAQLERMRAGDLEPGPPTTGPIELERIHAGIRDAAAALARARTRGEEQSARIVAQNRQLNQVLRLAREVAGSLNLRYVLRGVADAASAIAEQRVVVWLRTEDGRCVEPVADTAGPGLEPVGLDPVDVGTGIVGRSARFGRVEGHADGLGDHRDADRSEIAVPMVVGAEVIGVLNLVGPRAPDLPTNTLDVIEALAVQAAAAIGSARLHEHTETLAMTDALTRLPNRRRLEDDLAVEVGVSSRHGRPLGFAMIDVDHFKAYNDALGHQAGDAALQALARLLSDSVRAGDTVYRYGGEELSIVLRESSVDDAWHLLDRLRLAVEHAFAAPGQPRPITFSAGVASLPEHGRSAADLVAAADAALYEAKRTGRNRVCAATGTPEPAGVVPDGEG